MTEVSKTSDLPAELRYIQYEHSLERQYLTPIRALISKDLSEPYSIYVYRYFLYQWKDLCFMVSSAFVLDILEQSPTSLLTCPQAIDPTTSDLIGVIICKLEPHQSHFFPTLRGYIAMLAVASTHRNKGIAKALVSKAIEAMRDQNADEIVLETEEENVPAIKLYERLGFIRSKKLHRYYLNTNNAYRLILQLKRLEDMVGEEGL